MRARIAGSVVALLVLAALATPRAVDPDRGELAGTVFDAAGTRLPGVTITLSGPERRSIVSDGAGDYIFRSLLPGAYEMRATLPGFSTLLSKLSVAAGRAERRNIEMRVGRLSETITVTGESPRVDVQSSRREAKASDDGASPPAAPVLIPESSDARRRVPSQVASGLAVGIVGGVVGGVVGGMPAPPPPGFNTEAYDHIDESGFRTVTADPLSTFSIDVDTASYANVRRFLSQGALPPAGAVRIEEMINYFRYDYPQPSGDVPFSITTELAECPWNPKHRLALVGVQGRQLPENDETPRNLVFLIDVSGSMNTPDKLPLVRNAMRMLADVLHARDRVAIVVYAGASGLVLPSTTGDRKADIHRAIAELGAGGSTNGAAGIRLAYRVAREHFIRGGVNRVILATDGDFNVGVTSQDELVRLIEEERASGVFLSVLGVGTGNLKDSTMEKLADKGNGNYAYLDSLHEARKVLVREAGGTLVTIAKDVKIQVEFNPRVVAGYRLIGYENRALRNEDFNDDKKDAGEIGSGHSVTALYEIVPAGVDVPAGSVDALKYQTPATPAAPARAAASDELMTVKVRYKAPDGDTSRLVSTALRNRTAPMTANVGFASAVAELGMLLRGSARVGGGSFASVVSRARTFHRNDADGYRAEFIRLAELAGSLTSMQSGLPAAGAGRRVQ